MTSRGFIKDVAGVKRLRFVKPGYDADNYSIPANAVVLDSALPGAFGVFQSGTWSGTWPTSLTRVVTWVDPGYIPLVVFTWIYPDGRRRPNGVIGVTSGSTYYPNIMTARNDGIYIRKGTSVDLAGVSWEYIAYAVPT